jgi:hypothetical protein
MTFQVSAQSVPKQLTNLWRQSLESHILSHEIAASAVLAIVVARPIISPLDSSPHERRDMRGKDPQTRRMAGRP